MDTSFEEKVRARAYEIWMSAGMADGMAHEHWVIAEQAVAGETTRMCAKTSPLKAKAKPAAKPKTKASAGKPKPATKTAAKAKH